MNDNSNSHRPKCPTCGLRAIEDLSPPTHRVLVKDGSGLLMFPICCSRAWDDLYDSLEATE